MKHAPVSCTRTILHHFLCVLGGWGCARGYSGGGAWLGIIIGSLGQPGVVLWLWACALKPKNWDTNVYFWSFPPPVMHMAI